MAAALWLGGAGSIYVAVYLPVALFKALWRVPPAIRLLGNQSVRGIIDSCLRDYPARFCSYIGSVVRYCGIYPQSGITKTRGEVGILEYPCKKVRSGRGSALFYTRFCCGSFGNKYFCEKRGKKTE